MQYLEAATAARGHGASTLSQAINLAALYGRARQAHARRWRCSRRSRNVSPYGRMQIERVRHMAAVELGDQAVTARAPWPS